MAAGSKSSNDRSSRRNPDNALDCKAPEPPDDMEVVDSIDRHLAHLDAMMCAINGDGFESFVGMRRDLQADYLWACEEKVQLLRMMWREQLAAESTATSAIDLAKNSMTRQVAPLAADSAATAPNAHVEPEVCARLTMYQVPSGYMSPTVEAGDLVEIDTAVGDFDGDGVYLVGFAEGDPALRRIQRIGPGVLRVHCDSTSHAKDDVADGDICILGRATRAMCVKAI